MFKEIPVWVRLAFGLLVLLALVIGCYDSCHAQGVGPWGTGGASFSGIADSQYVIIVGGKPVGAGGVSDPNAVFKSGSLTTGVIPIAVAPDSLKNSVWKQVGTTQFTGTTSKSPVLLNAAGSNVVPNICPNNADTTTGISTREVSIDSSVYIFLNDKTTGLGRVVARFQHTGITVPTGITFSSGGHIFGLDSIFAPGDTVNPVFVVDTASGLKRLHLLGDTTFIAHGFIVGGNTKFYGQIGVDTLAAFKNNNIYLKGTSSFDTIQKGSGVLNIYSNSSMKFDAGAQIGISSIYPATLNSNSVLSLHGVIDNDRGIRTDSLLPHTSTTLTVNSAGGISDFLGTAKHDTIASHTALGTVRVIDRFRVRANNLSTTLNSDTTVVVAGRASITAGVPYIQVWAMVDSAGGTMRGKASVDSAGSGVFGKLSVGNQVISTSNISSAQYVLSNRNGIQPSSALPIQITGIGSATLADTLVRLNGTLGAANKKHQGALFDYVARAATQDSIDAVTISLQGDSITGGSKVPNILKLQTKYRDGTQHTKAYWDSAGVRIIPTTVGARSVTLTTITTNFPGSAGIDSIRYETGYDVANPAVKFAIPLYYYH